MHYFLTKIKISDFLLLLKILSMKKQLQTFLLTKDKLDAEYTIFFDLHFHLKNSWIPHVSN